VKALKAATSSKVTNADRVEKKHRLSPQDGRGVKRQMAQQAYVGESGPAKRRKHGPAALRRTLPKGDIFTARVNSNGEAVDWLQQQGFLRSKKRCAECRSFRLRFVDASAHHTCHWRCLCCDKRNYVLQQSLFNGLRCDPLTLVRMLRCYCSLPYNQAPRNHALTQQCHVGHTQADHFLGVLRQVEASSGLHWASQLKLSGMLEVDGTSLGKFAVKDTCIRFQTQIRALKAKLQRQGKPIPKIFFGHFQLYGILSRGGPAIMAIPSLPVTVPGSRPPTESLQGIRETALLEHVPVSKRSSSIVFSDGNRAWQRAAKDMRMRSKSVSHQN